MPHKLYELEIGAAARLLETGELTARALTQACVDRIAERNEEVKAFVAHDPELALREADRIDAGHGTGALRGIPFAVKDVIETADYPTAHGSPIYQGRRGGRDAGCVARAREQGAVLLGKVATSEFATQTPGAARNPLRLTHTPGGSSSGSAAAVADGMALAAWGTQTTGSIIRPAVYCGIVGYKPTYGLVSTAGVGTLSPLQDTVGALARSVADAATFVFGIHGARIDLQAGAGALRLGLCTSSQWAHARPETVAAIERFVARAGAAGTVIREVALPQSYERLLDAQRTMVSYDARHALAHERLTHPEMLSPRLIARIACSDGVDVHEYLRIGREAAQARCKAAELFTGLDALIYPAAEGEAEEGLDDSGSPRYGALWTLLHLPEVAFPIARGPSGLPLGVQLIGPHHGDLGLLAAAHAARRWADPA